MDLRPPSLSMETTKGATCFCRYRQGMRYFSYFIYPVSPENFKLAGDVGFQICVHRYDINNGVILELPQMTDILFHPVAIPEYAVEP